MVMLENIAAIVYSAFWPLKLDGRLAAATESKSIRFIICFYDYQPSAIVEISNGDFSVEPISFKSKELFHSYLDENDFDMVVTGYFQDTVEMTGGIGNILKAVLRRKIKIKHKSTAVKLMKIMGIKNVSTEGEGIS